MSEIDSMIAGETPVVDTIKEHDKTATEKLAEELFGENIIRKCK